MIFRLVELLLVLVPLAGAIYAAVRGISAMSRRQGKNHAEPVAEPAHRDPPKSQAAQWRTITRVLDEHSRTESRWLDYGLDPAELLDFPAMTDMRDPLTGGVPPGQAARRSAAARQSRGSADDPQAAHEYLDAVEAYATAFDAAEAEAARRRRSGFSRVDQQRLARARACCGSPPTTAPPSRSANTPTIWPAVNSTGWLSFPTGPGPLSSGASPGNSTTESH